MLSATLFLTRSATGSLGNAINCRSSAVEPCSGISLLDRDNRRLSRVRRLSGTKYSASMIVTGLGDRDIAVEHAKAVDPFIGRWRLLG